MFASMFVIDKHAYNKLQSYKIVYSDMLFKHTSKKIY